MKYVFFSFLVIFATLQNVSSQVASQSGYLDTVIAAMQVQWPKNRTINLVFHGHSVPSGYFKTPAVCTFDSYPHLAFHKIKDHYPYAVINVITTSIGGENSKSGAARFENEVLTHKPDVLFIDYALNDRGMSSDESNAAWSSMIEKAQAKGIKVILLTPTADTSANMKDPKDPLFQHAEQVRSLAARYHTGLVDSYALFTDYVNKGEKLVDLMSQINHPNRKGHELVADEIVKWFVHVENKSK